jgi:alpha-D-xyloside xylohydrolase
LYEDENDTYDYEKGIYATIPIVWDETKQTLTIGERKGTFPGILANRTFQVVFVKEGHGVGGASTQQPDKKVQYSGSSVTVTP